MSDNDVKRDGRSLRNQLMFLVAEKDVILILHQFHQELLMAQKGA